MLFVAMLGGIVGAALGVTSHILVFAVVISGLMAVMAVALGAFQAILLLIGGQLGYVLGLCVRWAWVSHTCRHRDASPRANRLDLQAILAKSPSGKKLSLWSRL